MPHKDKEKRLTYFRQYNAAHKEQRKLRDALHKEERRKYYLDNIDRIKAHQKKNQYKYVERKRAKRAALRPLVYVWINAEGKAEWVGRGTIERAFSHTRKSWWTPQHLLLSMTCNNEWQAMEYEGKWGQYYQPQFNKDGYRR